MLALNFEIGKRVQPGGIAGAICELSITNGEDCTTLL
jgi:hypothetical protein